MYTNFYLFLGSVIVISLSGVIMPGPVFAVSIAKGHSNGTAGSLIAVGHGLLELPLMVLIILGFKRYFSGHLALNLISVAGGAVLIYMGVKMFQAKGKENIDEIDLPYGSVTAGFAATGSNPYFYLWWGTVGATLITNAALFGFVGLVAFAVVHWLCDFLWYSFVSLATFKSHSYWTNKTHSMVFGLCGLSLIFLGVWFMASVIY
jgi:threonine/homoserine/homoserine lactone efflux protein